MQLTKGIFDEQDRKRMPFNLHSGQMRGKGFCHNAGWYNKAGEKLGWGDLSFEDILRISKSISENEVFLILSERDSFWNFVTKPGIIGAMCETSPDEKSPGIDYVLEKFTYLITKGKIYKSGWPLEYLGIKMEQIEKEQAKEIIDKMKLG